MQLDALRHVCALRQFRVAAERNSAQFSRREPGSTRSDDFPPPVPQAFLRSLSVRAAR
jgi:hypothetical protein